MGVSVLDREMFTEAAAARLLGVAQSTLNYWLEGGERRGRLYKPVIREQPRGSRAPVTWAEFIEAGLLREYRRTHRVPMAELRALSTAYACITRFHTRWPTAVRGSAARNCCPMRRTPLGSTLSSAWSPRSVVSTSLRRRPTHFSSA